VLTTGAQNAITTVLSSVTHPGDTILTEALTYPGVKAAARLLHLELEGLPLDRHGIVTDALERSLRANPGRVLYAIPTLQNPTTSIMPIERRAALVELCRRFDATLIEDNVYGFLVEDAPPPLARLAPERTYYLDSTSKLLGGGLRVGIVLAPPGQTIQQAAQRVAAQVRTASGIVTPLTAELARRWYEDGTADRLVAAQRSEAARRQRLAQRLLEPFPFHATPTAPIIWLPLPEPWRMDDFVFQARHRGVAVTPGSVFAVGREPLPNAVRVCLGSIPEDRLSRGLAILADLLGQSPETGLTDP
jgi:DNA-binding transcriptional MocR family regulator